MSSKGKLCSVWNDVGAGHDGKAGRGRRLASTGTVLQGLRSKETGDSDLLQSRVHVVGQARREEPGARSRWEAQPVCQGPGLDQWGTWLGTVMAAVKLRR